MYQQNVQQTKSYDEFMGKIWEMGKGNDDLAWNVLTTLVESPELSQKLLSAFFYFNPQTKQTMMLRPAGYIGQFLDNIRNVLANSTDTPASEIFKQFIQSFDQLNKERNVIINNQGDIIADFAERIKKYD